MWSCSSMNYNHLYAIVLYIFLFFFVLDFEMLRLYYISPCPIISASCKFGDAESTQ